MTSTYINVRVSACAISDLSLETPIKFTIGVIPSSKKLYFPIIPKKISIAGHKKKNIVIVFNTQFFKKNFKI